MPRLLNAIDKAGLERKIEKLSGVIWMYVIFVLQ